MDEFLKTYDIPKDIKLNHPTWKGFFGEVVSRFRSANGHKFLSEFIQYVGLMYEEAKRPDDFIIDLLSLGVDNLLSGDLCRVSCIYYIGLAASLFQGPYPTMPQMM